MIDRCVNCNEPLEQPATGRRRLYCCNRCRVRAQRRRSKETVEAITETGRTIPDPAIPENELVRALGPRAADPDEAVLECIMLARATAASFGVLAQRARPQLAWRCEAMADHIAAGLKRYFRSQ